ncbi:MAG: ABC transporter ATP-binding protein [Thermaerobacterales bacterium]
MIRVDGLTKHYGKNIAVQDLSFDVQKGELVGFLGPNGAGKTTTMRILTGYLAPTSGRAEVAGFDVAEDPIEVRRRIGYLPENAPVYGDMTVRQYLNYMAALKEVPPARRQGRLTDVMEQLALGHVAGRLVGNLSRGYRQRVGLGQALISDPPVLILDEPTAALDPTQIIEVRNLIKSLAGDRTILFSSHILSEVQAVSERVIIVNRGRLIAEDRPDELVRRLQKSRQYILRVAGGEAAGSLENLLAGTEGLASFEGVDDTRRAWRLTLTPGAGDEPLEKLFYTLAEARLPIMELSPADSTLEDVFLALIAAGDEADLIQGQSDQVPVKAGETGG